MRRLGWLHRLVPAALCALGAHAVLYRSFLPATGGHAYLSWYEPLVGGLSLVALLAFGAVSFAALRGSGSRVVHLVLPAAPASGRISTRTRRLALASFAFLVAQESCERMLAAHGPAVASLGAGEILTALGVLALLAWIVAVAERSCLRLIALVLERQRGPFRPVAAPSAPSRPRALRRANPLAERRGLRAPPLAA